VVRYKGGGEEEVVVRRGEVRTTNATRVVSGRVQDELGLFARSRRRDQTESNVSKAAKRANMTSPARTGRWCAASLLPHTLAMNSRFEKIDWRRAI